MERLITKAITYTNAHPLLENGTNGTNGTSNTVSESAPRSEECAGRPHHEVLDGLVDPTAVITILEYLRFAGVEGYNQFLRNLENSV